MGTSRVLSTSKFHQHYPHVWLSHTPEGSFAEFFWCSKLLCYAVGHDRMLSKGGLDLPSLKEGGLLGSSASAQEVMAALIYPFL